MDACTIYAVVASCVIVVLVIVYTLWLTYLYWYKPRRAALQRLDQQRAMDAARKRGELRLQQRQLLRQQQQQQQQQPIGILPL